jgi:DNA-binding NarL/FixJ family response regulator
MSQPVASKVPPDVRAEMVRRYVDEKQPMAKIGTDLFWSKGAVKNALILEGVEIRRRGQTPFSRLPREELDLVAEMYANGLSDCEIARRLGLASSTVGRRRAKAQVATRPRKERCRLARLHEIAQAGHKALTQRQREVLAVVEATPGLTTTQIGERLGLLTRQVRDPLDHMEGFGLVTSRVVTDHHGRVREWRRTELATNHVLWEAVNASRAGTYLPVEPLRAWLERRVERERRQRNVISIATRGVQNDEGVGVQKIVADRLGVNEREIYAYLHERQRVALDVADKMLTRGGDGTRLADLWPEHFDDEVALAA